MTKAKKMTERQKTAAIKAMLREQDEILNRPIRTNSKKQVLRFKMRNMRYLQMHPERTMHKAVLDPKANDWFPKEILDIADPVKREEQMGKFTALRHQLMLQRKYKHSCQNEMSILKACRAMGLMPKGTCLNNRETKAWEHRILLHKKAKSELRWRMTAVAKAKRRQKKPLTYAQILMGKNYKPGKGRKLKTAKAYVIRNGAKMAIA